MHISRRRLKQIALWGLIAVGIGLCVAGVFHPALVAAGVACIGAASTVRNRSEIENPQDDGAHDEAQAIEQDIEVDLGHHDNVLILSNAPCQEHRQHEEQKDHSGAHEAHSDDKEGVTFHERPPF
jgi:hypothetical protein